MVKINSKLIGDKELCDKIYEDVSKYTSDILKTFENPDVITLTSIKVDLKTKNVFVVYEDRSDEVKQISDLLKKAYELKSKIDTEQNVVKKSELIYELGQICKKYKELTGIDLSTIL